MKGVLLHGGAGTRLRPLTFSGPKQLVPVANKPVSQYALEDMVAAGVREVAIILGSTFPELVKEHYGDGSRFGARITYIYQGEPLGIAHAIGLAKEFVGGEEFVVYLGDNLLQEGIAGHVKEFLEEGYDAMVLLKEVGDPRMFGVAELDGEGRLVRLVEKPREPPSNLAVIGVYFFRPVVFDYIPKLRPSWRGELEVTDLIQLMIDDGRSVGYRVLEGWWIDTGKKDDILYANMLLLDERAKRNIRGKIKGSRVEGRVEVGEGSLIENSVIRGPAVIGQGCTVRNSFIGPYTSVGNGVVVEHSSVENSILMEEARISSVPLLEDSVIGRRAKVALNDKGRSSGRRSLVLHVGDYSEVLL